MKKSKIDQVADLEGFKVLADLAKELEIDTPTITNWRNRGISKTGAAKIKGRFGYTTGSLLDDSVELSKGLFDPAQSPFTEDYDEALQSQIEALVDTLSDAACSGFMRALGKRFEKSASSK